MRLPRVRFTLWRWVVVVATASASALLAIVAGVTASREAEALTRGHRHLRAIGLALHGYQEARGILPQGTVPNSSLPPERRLSWLGTLAPYWDVGGLYNAIDRDEAWDSPDNARLAQLNYLTDSGSYPGDLLRRGLTPYIGVAGFGADSPSLPGGHPRAGAFGYDRLTSARDIRDGLGTTSIVIETGRANGPWLAGGSATVRGLDPGHQPYIGSGCQFGGVGHKGALMLLADGSVRTLRKSIGVKVIEALATVAGGEQLPPGWDR